jgi:uncharacterized protein YycO
MTQMCYDTLNQQELLPGDLLLGFSAHLKGTDDELLSGYAHVAIQGLNGEVFEASASGVQKTNVTSLLNAYNHIAVVRADGAWSNDRILQLDSFLHSQIGKRFNCAGMYKIPKRKEELRNEAPPPSDRKQYFCSELVTSAFIDAGIIHKSASILLSPGAFSPDAIARDKVFGLFKGYIIPYDSYRVPYDDHFRTSI